VREKDKWKGIKPDKSLKFNFARD